MRQIDGAYLVKNAEPLPLQIFLEFQYLVISDGGFGHRAI